MMYVHTESLMPDNLVQPRFVPHVCVFPFFWGYICETKSMKDSSPVKTPVAAICVIWNQT